MVYHKFKNLSISILITLAWNLYTDFIFEITISLQEPTNLSKQKLDLKLMTGGSSSSSVNGDSADTEDGSESMKDKTSDLIRNAIDNEIPLTLSESDDAQIYSSSDIENLVIEHIDNDDSLEEGTTHKPTTEDTSSSPNPK